MPELPEVEVVRRGLSAKITNKVVQSVIVRREGLRWPFPADLRQDLTHRRIDVIERRGKYLLIGLDNHAQLLVHLGMTGSFIWYEQAPALKAHDHLDVCFADGVLRYNDPRRFGAVLWIDDKSAGHPLLEHLGIEPFDAAFNGRLLHKLSRGKTLAVKQFLLAGHAVVGVGNIYCSESLFRAGIRPTRAAGRVSLKEYELLAKKIVEVLTEAIDQGGSTLKDFKNSSGEVGYFQMSYAVYGREGLPCNTCRNPVRMKRQQQRASFYCMHCQR